MIKVLRKNGNLKNIQAKLRDTEQTENFRSLFVNEPLLLEFILTLLLDAIIKKIVLKFRKLLIIMFKNTK
jgi:hypothetical protein